MKNKKILIIGLCLVIVIVTILVVFKFNNKEKVLEAKLLSEKYNESIGEYKIFTNYNEFSNEFNNNSITKDDFEKNNILVFEIMYDSCSESDFEIKNINYKDNKLDILFEYKVSCGVCAPNYQYYFIKIGKNDTIKEFNIDYKAINTVDCPQFVAYKPMIYLYPTTSTKVNIKLGNSDYLTTTYPKYKDYWEVIANENGELIDNNGRKYYGLYWEGINHSAKVENDGFIVKGEDTISFLEEKLRILGLNEREANEFIVYWLPKLEINKYNYIRFETIEEINNYMPLIIEPVPDSIIRILMDYKPLNEIIEINEQKLVTPNRNGFTVVEWGGSLIN